MLLIDLRAMRYVRPEGAAQREKSQGSLPIQGRPRKALRGKKALSSQLSSAFSLSQSQSAAALVRNFFSEIQQSCHDVSAPHGIYSVLCLQRQHAAEELKQLYLSGARPWSPLRGAGSAAAAHQRPARSGSGFLAKCSEPAAASASVYLCAERGTKLFIQPHQCSAGLLTAWRSQRLEQDGQHQQQ